MRCSGSSCAFTMRELCRRSHPCPSPFLPLGSVAYSLAHSLNSNINPIWVRHCRSIIIRRHFSFIICISLRARASSLALNANIISRVMTEQSQINRLVVHRRHCHVPRNDQRWWPATIVLHFDLRFGIVLTFHAYGASHFRVSLPVAALICVHRPMILICRER